MTQPGQPGGAGSTAAARPATPAPAGGFFNRPGLLGGLAAGFLGAGLFGMLFGHGLMGGLGGFASILGLILQVALVVIVGMLLWAWWQRRRPPGLPGRPPFCGNGAPLCGSSPGLAHGLRRRQRPCGIRRARIRQR